MNKPDQFVAIIPARGGSKRLPGKNLMEIAGKPLIAWTIEAALKSGVFKRVIVSTDSSEIAKVASEYSAETPFIRPPEFSSDNSTTVDVLNHALNHIIAKDKAELTHFACLQPTSPLRSANDIRKAIDLLKTKKADAVISVCRNEHSPLWSNTLPEDNSMQAFLPENIQKTPSQKLPQYYRLNGAIYLCSVDRFLQEQTLFISSNIYAYEMSRKNSIDIDDEIDFELAGIYLSRI